MDTCPDCDFCEVLADGSTYCALYDELVDESGCCDDYQRVTRYYDEGDLDG